MKKNIYKKEINISRPEIKSERSKKNKNNNYFRIYLMNIEIIIFNVYNCTESYLILTVINAKNVLYKHIYVQYQCHITPNIHTHAHHTARKTILCPVAKCGW